MPNNLKSAYFEILESIVMTNYCELWDVASGVIAGKYFIIVTRNDGIINFLQNINSVIMACNI